MIRRLGLLITLFFVTANATEPVTIYNYVRAETDRTLRDSYERVGKFGALIHFRGLAPLDVQPVIRQNRDTLYSSGVLDLSETVSNYIA